jgi:hypothetical protein
MPGSPFRTIYTPGFAVSLKYLGNESDAEDMVMQVFEKLFTELRHTGVIHFKSWLYSVTRNCCLMQLRHRQTVEKSRNSSWMILKPNLWKRGAESILFRIQRMRISSFRSNPRSASLGISNADALSYSTWKKDPTKSGNCYRFQSHRSKKSHTERKT